MKKLNLAIIGQGRSGRDIHGAYYLSEANEYFSVKYVVEADARCREMATKRYDGCTSLADYRELFSLLDVDLVVNASYSDMHYGTTLDLLENGFNVLVEKPFARSRYECERLIYMAKQKGVLLGVFQNTFYAPYYEHALSIADSGLLGTIEQVSVRFNGFSRRWDWQTLQKKVAGSAYNTGPHPIGIALGFLHFDAGTQVAYSRLASTSLTSGDADDYVKILLTAPGRPLVDVEINSTDAYSDYTIKVQGDKGTFCCTPDRYKYKYIADGENPLRPVIEVSLRNEKYEPMYCGEKLVMHEKHGEYKGTAFDAGTAKIYENIYRAIVYGDKLDTAEKAAAVIGVIEQAHAQNPLPLYF